MTQGAAQPPDEFRSRLIGYALAVIAIVAWGLNFVIGRELAPDLHPIYLVFLRWAVASVFLFLVINRSIRRCRALIVEHRNFFLLIAFVGMAGYMTTVYLALRWSPVVNVSLLNGMSPIVLLAFLVITKTERVRAIQVVGCLVALGGLMYLLGEGRHAPWEIVELNVGDIWALLSAFGWAGYMLLAKRRPLEIPILVFHTVCVSLGVLYLVLPVAVVFAFEGFPEMGYREWGLILYLGLVPSVLCYWCWNAAIHRLGAATTGIVYYLIPVAASLESFLILGEELKPFHWVSMALILMGVVLAEAKRRQPKAEDAGGAPVAEKQG